MGTLLFIIHITDLSSCCKASEITLFADDTNVCSIGLTQNEIQSDLNEISNWLNSNQLCLNIKKTVQMNIGNSDSGNATLLLSVQFLLSLFKYLGIRWVYKMPFVSYADYVKKGLGKQRGIISKLRHYFPRRLLLQYYKKKY